MYERSIPYMDKSVLGVKEYIFESLTAGYMKCKPQTT